MKFATSTACICRIIRCFSRFMRVTVFIFLFLIVGYPFADGLPPPGVFNGFRPPLPTAVDPTRPAGLPPSLIGGKP